MTDQSDLHQRWRELATARQHKLVANSLAKLRQIDEDIDYSYEESMWAVASGLNRDGDESPEVSRQSVARVALRAKRYEILARLFDGLGK